MKFIFVAAVLFFAFSQGKVPVEKVYFMKGKTREKFVCKGRLVALNVEMARVAMVELKFSKCCHDTPHMRRRYSALSRGLWLRHIRTRVLKHVLK